MTSTMMSTHKAFKALQQAGIDDQQAEAMVEVFTDMQQRQPGGQVGKQLGQIQTKANHIDIRLDQLTTKVDQIDGQLGQLTTKVHQIDERLGHVERKTDKLAIRFNQLEAKVDKLDVALSEMNFRLTSAVDCLRNDVVTLTTDMRWIKRLSILMTTTLLAAVLKDILM
ncbi:hypothetical protein [Pantoea agglomerans]|uniref:hypothetical protein n=1 Tax=Enterobacter agglomerans TaxID=549 RepID=UPI0013BC3C23|nr:hypothetical protein [Pantoea agglomerans]NEG58711.1 hypothetical protein [Pantoea agglomerans]NEH00463.1 hypothetical protein [Pantoea agglomerans]NEH02563.1 hypothetical protein [Pantoea agglomerans]NEH15701.1 hypothetical protein [Pantoea agglomerans]